MNLVPVSVKTELYQTVKTLIDPSIYYQIFLHNIPTPGLVSLIDFHDSLSSLSDGDFLKWIEQLVCNQKKLIICGIFRELYHQGRNIDNDTFNHMVDTANNLVTQSNTTINISKSSQTASTLNLLNHIPDSILSDIVTYLKTRELFSIWNNICKKSLRIGMKPQSIKHWHVSVNNSNSKLFTFTKFDIYPLLSQVEDIRLNQTPYFHLSES